MKMAMRKHIKKFYMDDYFDEEHKELRKDLEVLGSYFFDFYYVAFERGKINPDVRMAKSILIYFEDHEDYDKCVKLREYIKEREIHERTS